MNETHFDGDDWGEAFHLDLDREGAPPRDTYASMPAASFSEQLPHSVPLRIVCSQFPESHSQHVPLATRSALFVAMSRVSMEIWKRVAVYPLLAWFVLFILMPCRLTFGTTALLLGAGAIGITGAWARLHVEKLLG